MTILMILIVSFLTRKFLTSCVTFLKVSLKSGSLYMRFFTLRRWRLTDSSCSRKNTSEIPIKCCILRDKARRRYYQPKTQMSNICERSSMGSNFSTSNRIVITISENLRHLKGSKCHQSCKIISVDFITSDHI